MVTPVQVFRTQDGEVFGSEAEAQAHESRLVNAARVEAFVDKTYPPTEKGRISPKRVIARDAILAFLAEQ